MKHKKIFITLAIILSLLVIFVVFTYRQKSPPPGEEKQNNPNAPRQANFSDLLNQSPAESNAIQAFFLNQVNTLTGVTGYSWNKNQLIYSTPQGIYVADGNQPLIAKPINSISWNSLAQAIFSQNNQWFLYNAITKVNPLTPLQGITAKLHPTKSFVAIQNVAKINIFSLDDFNTPMLTVNSPTKLYYWAFDLPIIAWQADQIEIYNLSNQEKSTFPIPASSQLVGISPNGQFINIFTPQDQNLLLLDQSGKTVKTINLPETKKLSINWLDEQNFIALATSASDSLGRIIDFIWLVNTAGEKKFLANSQPIPNKLDLNIPIYINTDKNVIGLIENQNTLWVLSLLPDQFPSYYEQSVNFFNPSTQGD